MMIDALFVILLFIAAIKGYSRGLIVALFSFLAIIIGLIAAMKLSAVVANYLENSAHVNGKWLPILSFSLVMFVVILLVKWGGKIIEKIAQIALMGWANKLAGIVLYAALYTTILSIILFFAEKIQLLQSETISASKCYWFIQPWAPKIIDGLGMVIPTFKGLFVQLDHFFTVIATKSK